MSLFQIDCECDYKEYKRTIFYHADNFKLQNRPPSSHYNVCEDVYKKAIKEKKDGKFDFAFYYFVRCITIIEKAGLRNKIPESKTLMKDCINEIEELQTKQLPLLHSHLIEKVREREVERKRIVSQQLLLDEDGEQSDTLLEEHQKRQQKLLMNENILVNDALKRLKRTQIPTSVISELNNIEPYWRNPNNNEILSNSDKIIAPPRKILNVSPNAYNEWNFNNSSSHVSYRRRGMVNLGNTCYLNSITQLLYATPIGLYFLNDDYTKDIVENEKGKGRLVNSLSFVMRELHRTDCITAVSPSPFKEAVGEYSKSFIGFSQQDANEFLRVLLDGIHSSLNDRGNVKRVNEEINTTKGGDSEIAKQYWLQYTRQNNSVIVDKCVFQERSTVVCPSCKHVSRSFTPSLGIEVPIPSSKGPISIEDCLKAYCKEEILDSGSLYSCPSCKKNVSASKQLLIYSLPTVLFVTLKRFRCYGDFSNKVSEPVVFQKQLDMSNFMCSNEKNTIYNLVGVVNHQGNIHGGHYTADCIGTDGVWFSFSDERVNEATIPDYKLAYVLCYVRN